MVKSDFFRLLLHQIYENGQNMVKKKKDKKTNSGTSFSGVLGVGKIFHNEKLNFILGILFSSILILLSGRKPGSTREAWLSSNSLPPSSRYSLPPN